MKLYLFILTNILYSSVSYAHNQTDKQAIIRATQDYIQSQHSSSVTMMKRGLHKKLAKRTYWKAKDNTEFIMQTDYHVMLDVAQNYNKDRDKFPEKPLVKIQVLDIDQRIASVKLTTDDWVDYMHLIKDNEGSWKIINVLWQYHDTQRHRSN